MDDASRPRRPRRLTVALLAGTATMGAMAFVATLFQTPGLDGPVELAPAFVVVTVVGVTALPLVWWGDPVGLGLSAVAGAAAVLGIALYLAGAFGPARVAPAAYVFAVLGALLVVAAVVAWRDRSSRVPPAA